MGLEFLPGKLRREQQVTLLRALRDVMDEARALYAHHAALRQTHVGAHDELRSARLGHRQGARISLSGHPSDHRQTVAGHAADAARISGTRLRATGRRPKACLVNYYDDDAKMGLHQDKDEED